MFGEDRLQCAFARQPLLGWQDEQAVACQVPHFLVDVAPLGQRILASQHVVDPGGRGDQNDGRDKPLRAQLDSGYQPAGVAQQLLPGVENPHRLHQLPIRQRVLRRQRQRSHVGHACQLSTSPSPFVITVPAITLSR